MYKRQVSPRDSTHTFITPLLYVNQSQITAFQNTGTVPGNFDVFKFVDMDTQLVEIEDGVAENESVTVATRAAIEAAVVAIIIQGDARGFWNIQESKGDESEETK